MARELQRIGTEKNENEERTARIVIESNVYAYSLLRIIDCMCHRIRLSMIFCTLFHSHTDVCAGWCCCSSHLSIEIQKKTHLIQMNRLISFVAANEFQALFG